MYKKIFISIILMFYYSCTENSTDPKDEKEPEKLITQILFIQDINDTKSIGVIDDDGQNKNIIINDVDPSNLRFSTDGYKITYENKKDGNVYLADSDGNNLTIILENLWGVFGVKLLSQKNLFYIAAYENDGTSSVYYEDISNNIRTKIIDHESSLENIAVSPDEEFVFFSLKSDALYIMNWDGQNRKKVFDGWCLFPISYSFDGSQILFSMRTIGLFEIIYTGDSNGENINNVTNDSLHAEYPAFSPDATKIVFADNYSGYAKHKLSIINSDSTTLNTIYLSDYRIKRPQFTHDGLKIIFEMNANIYSIKIDGTELIQLVNNARYPIIKPNSM